MLSSSKTRTTVIVIGIVILVLAVFFLWHKQALTSSKGYQAVFLTNNQVYFGKVSHPYDQYVELTDIYYIQLTQNLQPQDQKQISAQNLNLVKLGNELHGPEDKMDINRDQILFIEDLKPDSQVVKAIDNYKQGQGQ